MTAAEARAYIADHEDDDVMDDVDLEAVFLALHDRPADDHDRETGLWSLCCAAV
jgi:hypothetical protein